MFTGDQKNLIIRADDSVKLSKSILSFFRPTRLNAFIAFYKNKVDLIEAESKNGGLFIKGAANFSIPLEFFSEGEIRDKESMAFLMQEFIKKSGWRGKIHEAVALIPEGQLFSRLIQFDKGEVNEAAIREKVSATLPLPIDDMVCDLAEIKPLVPEGVTHRDVAVFAVAKSFLKTYEEVLRMAKIKPKDYYSEVLSLTNLIFPQGETKDAVLLVLAGSKRLVLTIFAGRAIHFSAVLPFGISDLDTAGNVDSLVAELRGALLFYRERVFHEHGASSEVNRMILLGENSPKLDEILSMNAQLHIERPDMWQGITFKTSDTEKTAKNDPANFLPLIGMAKKYLIKNQNTKS